jgi:hypothetical protein
MRYKEFKPFSTVNSTENRSDELELQLVSNKSSGAVGVEADTVSETFEINFI